MEFHERLKQIRLDKGLTQKQVADGIGITEQSFQRYERGAIKPGLDALSAIADFLDVPADYLMGRSDDRYVACACAVPAFLHEKIFSAMEGIGISRSHITRESRRAAVCGEGFIVDELTPSEAERAAKLIEKILQSAVGSVLP